MSNLLLKVIGKHKLFDHDFLRFRLKACCLAFFFVFCFLSSFGLSSWGGNSAIIGLSLFLAVFLGQFLQTGLRTKMQLFEIVHGSLSGFKTKDTIAYDLEDSFESPQKANPVFHVLCNFLNDTHAKFYSCDELKGEIVARVAMSSCFAEPCDVYLRVQSTESGSVVSARVIASVLSHNPGCFEFINLLRGSLHKEAFALPPLEHKPSVSKWRFPLYSKQIAKSLAIAAIPLVSALTFFSAPSSIDVSNLLDCNEYKKACELVCQNKAQSFDQFGKFVSLLGLEKYDDAINSVDINDDKELIAYALASQGKMAEAEKVLNSIDLNNKEADIGALYLTKALVEHSKGNDSAVVSDLMIVNAVPNNLHNLGLQQQLKLNTALHRTNDAEAISEKIALNQRLAQDYIKLPWWYLLAFIGSASALSFLPVLFERKRTKAPGMPSPRWQDCNLVSNLGWNDSFDRCLRVVAENSCTVTHMDDESGIVEALDADGQAIKLKLKTTDNELSMCITSPLPVPGKQKSATVENLRLALATAEKQEEPHLAIN